MTVGSKVLVMCAVYLPKGFQTTPNNEERMAAGECVLLHNYLPHASEIDMTEIPRRAFSVSYMEAATQTTSGETYAVLFGDGAFELEGRQSK